MNLMDLLTMEGMGLVLFFIVGALGAIVYVKTMGGTHQKSFVPLTSNTNGFEVHMGGWRLPITLHGVEIIIQTNGVDHKVSFTLPDWPPWLGIGMKNNRDIAVTIGGHLLDHEDLQQLAWPDIKALQRAFLALGSHVSRSYARPHKNNNAFDSSITLNARHASLVVVYDLDISNTAMVNDLKKAIGHMTMSIQRLLKQINHHELEAWKALYQQNEHSSYLREVSIAMALQGANNPAEALALWHEHADTISPEGVARALSHYPSSISPLLADRRWSTDRWLDVLTAIYTAPKIDDAFKAQCLSVWRQHLAHPILPDLKKQTRPGHLAAGTPRMEGQPFLSTRPGPTEPEMALLDARS